MTQSPFNLTDLFNAAGQFVQQAQPVQQQTLAGTQRMLQGIPNQNAAQSWDQYNQATQQAALNQMRPGTSFGLNAAQAAGIAALGEPNKINAPGVGNVEFNTYKNLANAAQLNQGLNDRRAQGFNTIAQQGLNKIGVEREVLNSPIPQRIASPDMLKTELAGGMTLLDTLVDAPSRITKNVVAANQNMSPTEQLQTVNDALGAYYKSLGDPQLGAALQEALHAPDARTVGMANEKAKDFGLTINPQTTMNQEMSKMASDRTKTQQSMSSIEANYKNLAGFQRQLGQLPNGTVTSNFAPVVKQIFANGLFLDKNNALKVTDADGKAHNYDPAKDNLAAMMPNLVSPLTGEPYVTPEQINKMVVKDENGYSLNGARMKELMETVSAKAFEDNVKALAVTTEGGFRDIDQQFSLGMSPEQRVKLQSANWVPYDQVKNSYTTKIADKINKLAKEYASKDMGVSENDARQEILQRLLQEGSAKKSLDGSLDMLEKTLKGIKNGSNRK